MLWLFLSGMAAGAALACWLLWWAGRRALTPKAKSSPTLNDLRPKDFSAGATQVPRCDVNPVLPGEAVFHRLEIPDEDALELLNLYDKAWESSSRADRYLFWKRAHKVVPELHKWPQAKLKTESYRPYFEVEVPNGKV